MENWFQPSGEAQFYWPWDDSYLSDYLNNVIARDEAVKEVLSQPIVPYVEMIPPPPPPPITAGTQPQPQPTQSLPIRIIETPERLARKEYSKGYDFTGFDSDNIDITSKLPHKYQWPEWKLQVIDIANILHREWVKGGKIMKYPWWHERSGEDIDPCLFLSREERELKQRELDLVQGFMNLPSPSVLQGEIQSRFPLQVEEIAEDHFEGEDIPLMRTTPTQGRPRTRQPAINRSPVASPGRSQITQTPLGQQINQVIRSPPPAPVRSRRSQSSEDLEDRNAATRNNTIRRVLFISSPTESELSNLLPGQQIHQVDQSIPILGSPLQVSTPPSALSMTRPRSTDLDESPFHSDDDVEDEGEDEDDVAENHGEISTVMDESDFLETTALAHTSRQESSSSERTPSSAQSHDNLTTSSGNTSPEQTITTPLPEEDGDIDPFYHNSPSSLEAVTTAKIFFPKTYDNDIESEGSSTGSSSLGGGHSLPSVILRRRGAIDFGRGTSIHFNDRDFSAPGPSRLGGGRGIPDVPVDVDEDEEQEEDDEEDEEGECEEDGEEEILEN